MVDHGSYFQRKLYSQTATIAVFLTSSVPRVFQSVFTEKLEVNEACFKELHFFSVLTCDNQDSHVFIKKSKPLIKDPIIEL